MNSINTYEKYPLYLQITAFTLVALTTVWGLFLYLLYPGLARFGIAVGVEIILALPPLFFWLMWGILYGAAKFNLSVSSFLLRLSNRSLYFLFPFVVEIGKVMDINRDRISQGMIDLINHLVESSVYRVAAKDILLLTPHCIQKNTCVHKITNDVYNCKQCGQCQVSDLLDIAKEYGCQFVVVTGGTLARMMVKKAAPKAIIAIACERDLVSGMQDVFPIPVIGILNERPCGPCCNTRVDIGRIKKVVEQLIYGRADERK